MIDHLSHELQTPIAILTAAFELLSKKLQHQGLAGFDGILKRGKRYIARLERIHSEMGDIFSHTHNGERDRTLEPIEDLVSIVEELHEQGVPPADLIGQLVGRLRTPAKEAVTWEPVDLGRLLNEICNRALSAMPTRELTITRAFETGTIVHSSQKVIETIVTGLLRNAIENTPDGSTIEVSQRVENGEAVICVRDCGVGILEEHQQLIFGGFYHTQDTSDYCSKHPYAFNAGGSGADLLRIKILSQVHGLSLGFWSTRCRYLPSETDRCPGKVSLCRFVRDNRECCAAGGSAFVVSVPIRP